MTRTLLVAVFFLSLGVIMSWLYDRTPKVIGYNIPDGALQPKWDQIKRNIVLYHNFFRSRVQPPAANMLEMKWHTGAARAAQNWADECQYLIHNKTYDKNYGECGQNIFTISKKVPWFIAIKKWYLEKHNFTYGSPNYEKYVIGHYTQMVWATTHEVGCGFTKCLSNHKEFYNYVCNYCPGGNVKGKQGYPYKLGKRCSLCKNSCNAKKLCTNSCPVVDKISNCDQLNSSWPDRFCERRGDICKATCQCQGKIY